MNHITQKSLLKRSEKAIKTTTLLFMYHRAEVLNWWVVTQKWDADPFWRGRRQLVENVNYV